jgi:hypothetical protein
MPLVAAVVGLAAAVIREVMLIANNEVELIELVVMVVAEDMKYEVHRLVGIRPVMGKEIDLDMGSGRNNHHFYEVSRTYTQDRIRYPLSNISS